MLSYGAISLSRLMSNAVWASHVTSCHAIFTWYDSATGMCQQGMLVQEATATPKPAKPQSSERSAKQQILLDKIAFFVGVVNLV